ncbi:MAG TPA: nuclear transport factor 2 family protein [Terriglobales bacterium]|nr:nuclear transport factor 2 family protein [Terriglobales bacterium]
MKSKLPLFVMLFLGLSWGVPSFAQTHSDAENKLIAMENAWSAAQKDHDIKALDAMLAESFVNTESDGSFSNKSQFLADSKDTTYKYDLVATNDVLVFTYANGTSAIVVGVYHIVGSRKGKPFDIRGRFTDTWMSLNGKWQCVASASTHIAKPAQS